MFARTSVCVTIGPSKHLVVDMKLRISARGCNTANLLKDCVDHVLLTFSFLPPQQLKGPCVVK